MELASNMGAFEALNRQEMLEVDGGISKSKAYIIGMLGPVLAQDLVNEYTRSYQVGYYEAYTK